MNGLLLAGLFVAVPGAVMVPALRELVRPKDDAPMPIDLRDGRDPHHRGVVLREALAVSSLTDPSSIALDVRVIRAGAEMGDALAPGSLTFEPGSSGRAVHAAGRVRLLDGAQVNALAADQSVATGDGVTVRDLLDAVGAVRIGRRCQIARCVSAERISMGAEGRFAYLSAPIIRTANADPGDEGDASEIEAHELTIEDAVIWCKDRMSIPIGMHLERDVVAYGDVHIGADTRIDGTVKAHGSITVGPRARIGGNLIARKNIQLGPDAEVAGNIFADGDLSLARGCRVGRPGAIKTAHAGGTLRLGREVAVYGVVSVYGIGIAE